MNKRQLEVEKAKLADEKKVLAALKKQYEEAAKEVQAKIRIHDDRIKVDMKGLENWDDLDEETKSIVQSQIYQKKFQQQLKAQIDEIVKKLNDGQYESVQEYLNDSYTTAAAGNAYDLHGQGVPLVIPIDRKAMLKSVELDPKLSDKLYGSYMEQMKDSIRAEVSRGIATADSYEHIARNISSKTNQGFNKTMRIVRTEGHRIQIEAAYEQQKKAKQAGADIVKQWDSTLDGKTRPTHRKLDGQIRELDEPFEVGGHKAMHPAGFGRPEEDINCRCALLQRARWALDDDELETLKQRAEYFGLDKTENFSDFKQKYLKVSDKIVSVEEILQQVQEYNDKISDNDKKIRNVEKDIEKYNSSKYDEYLDVSRKDVEKQLQEIEEQLAELKPLVSKYYNRPESGTEERKAWREWKKTFDHETAIDKQMKLSVEKVEKDTLLNKLKERDDWLDWKKKHPIDQLIQQKTDYESEAINLKKGLEKLQKNYLKTVDNLNAAGYNIVNITYIENTYGAAHAKAVKDNFKTAPPEVKRVWSKYQGSFRTVDANYSGSKANYSPAGDAVTLNIADVAKGNSISTPYQTLYHEYGHMTDYLAAREFGFNMNTAITEVFDGLDANGAAIFTQKGNGGLLGRTAKEELKEMLKDIKKKHGVTKKDEAAQILIDEITKNYSLLARGDLSDILEGAGIGKAYPLGAGHGSSYWKGRDNGKEIFAEFISAETNNHDSLECMKKYFPKTYQVYKDIIEVIK